MSDQKIPENPEEKSSSKFIRFLSEPLSSVGWPAWLIYIMAFIGAVYILNPTFGAFELIPDNLPIIGNMDEGVAVMLILAGLVEVIEGRKLRRERKNQAQAMPDSNPPASDIQIQNSDSSSENIPVNQEDE